MQVLQKLIDIPQLIHTNGFFNTTSCFVLLLLAVLACTPLYYRLGPSAQFLRERSFISGAVLKVIAMVTMFIDHAGATIALKIFYYYRGIGDVAMSHQALQIYNLMRRIGRVAFPIFCFLLVEGFLHTRNIKKYVLNMAIFCLISDFPFDWALHPTEPFMNKQNVYFTLLIGLLVMWGVSEMKGRLVIQMLMMITGMTLSVILKTDYNIHGVFLIEVLYITRTSRSMQSLMGGAYVQYYEKMPTPLSFLLTFFYNGKRGRQLKYFNYLFYPGHLLLLGIINNLILPHFLK